MLLLCCYCNEDNHYYFIASLSFFLSIQQRIFPSYPHSSSRPIHRILLWNAQPRTDRRTHTSKTPITRMNLAVRLHPSPRSIPCLFHDIFYWHLPIANLWITSPPIYILLGLECWWRRRRRRSRRNAGVELLLTDDTSNLGEILEKLTRTENIMTHVF